MFPRLTPHHTGGTHVSYDDEIEEEVKLDLRCCPADQRSGTGTCVRRKPRNRSIEPRTRSVKPFHCLEGLMSGRRRVCLLHSPPLHDHGHGHGLGGSSRRPRRWTSKRSSFNSVRFLLKTVPEQIGIEAAARPKKDYKCSCCPAELSSTDRWFSFCDGCIQKHLACGGGPGPPTLLSQMQMMVDDALPPPPEELLLQSISGRTLEQQPTPLSPTPRGIAEPI
jgi:hypothetical protein